MILVDANLLLYAVNRDQPFHIAAKDWWQEALSGSETVGIPWVVILAFIRITTNPRIFEAPLRIEQAMTYIDEWLAQPNVSTISPGEGHWNVLSALLKQSGAAANLTTDAHIAALAVEFGFDVYSADNDFQRFAGVTHINPLQCRNSSCE